MFGINRSKLVLAVMLLSLAGCRPTYYPQQSLIADCPVPSQSLPDVFTGRYGTDILHRPLNRIGIPVDLNGNCLADSAVTTNYVGYPSQQYINVLTSRYGYGYHGGGLYFGGAPVHYGVSLYSPRGVTVNRTYVPVTRRVNNVTTLRPAQRTFTNTNVYGGGSAPIQRTNYTAPYRPSTSRSTYDSNRPTSSFTAPTRTFSAPTRRR